MAMGELEGQVVSDDSKAMAINGHTERELNSGVGALRSDVVGHCSMPLNGTVTLRSMATELRREWIKAHGSGDVLRSKKWSEGERARCASLRRRRRN